MFVHFSIVYVTLIGICPQRRKSLKAIETQDDNYCIMIVIMIIIIVITIVIMHTCVDQNVELESNQVKAISHR